MTAANHLYRSQTAQTVDWLRAAVRAAGGQVRLVLSPSFRRGPDHASVAPHAARCRVDEFRLDTCTYDCLEGCVVCCPAAFACFGSCAARRVNSRAMVPGSISESFKPGNQLPLPRLRQE